MKFCILIPAYQEEQGVRRSILSCYKSGMQHEDVYVVDDGSTDETAAVAAHYRAQVLTKANGGKASALEAGIRHFDLVARYDYIGFLDADSMLAVDYVYEMRLAATRFPDAALLTGRPVSQKGKFNFLTALRALDYSIGCGVYREAQHAIGVINVAPGCCSVYKAEVLPLLKWDAGTVTEDMYWTVQLQRLGKQIVYVPDACVMTQDPRTLKDFIGQLLRWDRGTWQVIKAHKLMRVNSALDWYVGSLILEQGLFTLFLLLLPLLVWLYPVFILLGLCIDQVIVAVYAMMTARRDRRWDVLAAFPSFILLRMLSAFLFSWSYLLELRTAETKWFKPERY